MGSTSFTGKPDLKMLQPYCCCTGFPAAGAHPYQRDLKNLEFHLLDTGHFALEEDGAAIATLMRDFLDKQVKE